MKLYLKSLMESHYKLRFADDISKDPPFNARSSNALGSNRLQSELVDGAISQISCSLPTEVMRLTSLQHQQSSQISLLQGELQHLQEQITKATEKTAKIKAEIEHIKQQIYMLEEDKTKVTKGCIQHKTELVTLVQDCDAKRRVLSIRGLELHVTKKKLMQYRQKLDDYITSITTTDNAATIMAEIDEVQKRIAVLKDKKDYMNQNPEETTDICSGSVETSLMIRITDLSTQSDDISKDIKQLQQQIDSIHSKQGQVKQATSVLQKRNAAQIIQLKRLFKQQQLRHHQWVEQRHVLQQTMHTLNQKLQSN